LPAFVDPRLTAKEGHPVWLPQTGAAGLHFDAVCFDNPTADRPGLVVTALPNVEHILLDAIGRQHVILCAGSTSLQLTINGQECIISPTTLALHLRSRHEIRTVRDALTALEAVLSAADGLPSAPPPWTAETERLRDALIALDCYRAGLTLRETAVVIYGRQRVDCDWPGKGLRDRMRRSRQRGLALCNAGYRDLLR
jgi:hypothetical protein